MLSREISKSQCQDTGMAMVLLLLIAHAFTRRDALIVAAIVAQVITMTVPQAFRYVAVVWLGLSHLIGIVVSTVVLSAVFLVVVTPIAVVRRWAGLDSLGLRAFKSGKGSAMLERRHVFTSQDVEKPY